MSNSGKVAIITRTKDRPVLLQRTLDSALKQTYRDWVQVVINDGGDPAPVDELIAARKDQYDGRVVVVHNEKSLGMEAASNKAIASAESDFIVIHDDDDSWEPTFLEEVMQTFNNRMHPSVRGVVTHADRVIEEIAGDSVNVIKHEPYNAWLQRVSLERMLAENMWAPISFVFERAAYDEVGPYREDLPVLGDWEFNVRFLQKYEVFCLQRVLAHYHDRRADHSSSYGSTITAKRHLHLFYDNLLRNEWVRKDLAEGKMGLGALANESRLAFEMKQVLWKLDKKRGIVF